MRTAQTLIRLGGCPGWSKSSLGAHAHVSLLVLSCRRSDVRIVCQSSHTHQGYLFCCSDIMDTIWLILRVYTDSHWYSVQWFHSEWDHYQFSPLYNNISVLHGHQSIFFIAYTSGTKLFVSCFWEYIFRNRTMLYGRTLIGVLKIAFEF